MSNGLDQVDKTQEHLFEGGDRRTHSGDGKGSRLLELRRQDELNQKRLTYFLQNRRRLEEQRPEEGLTDDPRKQWRIGKDHIDDQSKPRQIEQDYVNDQSKQQRIEQDHIDDQSKQRQIREDLNQRAQQRIGEDPDLVRQWQREKIFTEKIIQLLQNDAMGQVLEENKDKAFNKSKFEGTDEQEKADPATPKNPSRPKNPNQSDPFFESTQQQDSTTSTDRSSSHDFTREGTNPQWRADQATSYKQSEFVRSQLDDSKSTGPDSTPPSEARKSADQQSAKAAQRFSSTDDLYTKAANEVIAAFRTTDYGKLIFNIEQDLARTQKEFYESGSARGNGEKVGIDNPQEIVNTMQRVIERDRLRLVNAFDPSLAKHGQVQNEEYYRCLKDLERHLRKANTYMRNMIDVTKSKTNFSSNTPQWRTPPLVHAIA